jgi:hypothetical protein
MNQPTRGTDAVIVIFGAAVRPGGGPSTTLRHRVEAAAAFGARLTAPLYLPTGAKGRHGASEASVMARLLRETGVPPDRILLEETGTDTLSSVRAVARMLTGTAPVYVRDERLPPPALPAAVATGRDRGVRLPAATSVRWVLAALVLAAPGDGGDPV